MANGAHRPWDVTAREMGRYTIAIMVALSHDGDVHEALANDLSEAHGEAISCIIRDGVGVERFVRREDEGVTWCRGWEGEAADALRAAAALGSKR